MYKAGMGKKTSFSSYVDTDLMVVIKRLALEESLTRDDRVSITTLLNEALWDLVEKYGKAKPGNRPLVVGEMKPDRSGRRKKAK